MAGSTTDAPGGEHRSGRGADGDLVAASLGHLLGPEVRAWAPVVSDVELFGLVRRPGIQNEAVGELVRLARDGDRDAFGELYRRLAPMVAATAQRTVSDQDVVADVVQETFARALERLDQLREPDSIPAWLSGIARRVATDALRSRYRSTSGLDEQLRDLGATEAGPDSAAEQRMRLHEVGIAIGLLSKSDARMVILVAELSLTTDELARALGVAPGAARVRLHRARRRLDRLLEPSDEFVSS